MSNPLSFDVTCFGAAHIDQIAKAEETLVAESSTPGRIKRSVGGVASNVARQLARQGLCVAMAGQTGLDNDGDFVRKTLEADGVNTDMISTTESEATGGYLAIEDHRGDLVLAVSDTHALLTLSIEDLTEAARKAIPSVWWFVDSNLTPDLLEVLINAENHPPIAVDAVSVSKVGRLQGHLSEFDLVFCNRDEASALFEQKFESAAEAGQAMAAKGASAAIITDGPQPVCVQSGADIELIEVPAVTVNSVTGAGDALIAGTLAELVGGAALKSAVTQGISTAARQLGRQF